MRSGDTNNIVELRLASPGDCYMASDGGTIQSPGKGRGKSIEGIDFSSGARGEGHSGAVRDKCIVIGRYSCGVVCVWDVLGRQLLANMRLPHSSDIVLGIRALPSLQMLRPHPTASSSDEGYWASEPLLALARTSAADTTALFECPDDNDLPCKRAEGVEGSPAYERSHPVTSSGAPISRLTPVVLCGGDRVEFLPSPDLSFFQSKGSTSLSAAFLSCTEGPGPLLPAHVSVSCFATLAGLVASGTSSGQVGL